MNKKVILVILLSFMIGCSPRYTKQFVADDTVVEEYLLKDISGWNVQFPVLSAYTNVKDVSAITDTNKYWLTLNCIYPLENANETKRDFDLDTIHIIYHVLDSSKYQNLLQSNDRKILEKVFNWAHEKKRDYSMTVGACFAKYPFVENDIITKIDSLHIAADTFWTTPSRKAQFFDTDKNNYFIVYNFYQENYLTIPENVKRVTLYFDYKIINDAGTLVSHDTVYCDMGKQISTEARLFFLQ